MQETEKESKCEKRIKKVMQHIICGETEKNADLFNRNIEANCADKCEQPERYKGRTEICDGSGICVKSSKKWLDGCPVNPRQKNGNGTALK